MTKQTRYSAARGGKPCSIQLDPVSLVRFAFCSRVCSEHLGVNVGLSTIVRRALVLYQAHCEALLAGGIGKPEDADVYRRIEAAQLRIVNKGNDSGVVTIEMVRNSPELLTLEALRKAAMVPRPLLNDKLKGELKNWTPAPNRG